MANQEESTEHYHAVRHAAETIAREFYDRYPAIAQAKATQEEALIAQYSPGWDAMNEKDQEILIYRFQDLIRDGVIYIG